MDQAVGLKRKKRVNLRLPIDLEEWARRYSCEVNMTLTDLVVAALTEVKRRVEDIPQI